MIDPYRLMEQFFDVENGFSLKEDENGEPMLREFKDIASLIEKVPYNQLPSVTKIFDLKPAKIGLLFAGVAAIGDHSVKNLIDLFRSDDDVKKYLKGTYTVSGTAKRLYNHISGYYENEFSNGAQRPAMEILVSGYSKRYNQPEVQKIQLGDGHPDGDEGSQASISRGDYRIVFGGQHDVIQRVIYGLDMANFGRYIRHVDRVTDDYRREIQETLDSAGVDVDIPTPQKLHKDGRLDLYAFDWVRGITTDFPNFSEQASIDLVDFLVDVMCRAQQFSNRLPTVGGDIHIAIITKSGGFRWISKEEYTYKGRGVPKHD